MAHILIAEDDAHIKRVLCIWLKRNGHDVTEACDGLAAQRAMEDAAFDILVSDVNMPGLDGVSLVRWVREDQGSAMPVILLTSRCDQQSLASQLAKWDVVMHAKPFSPSRLASLIELQLRQDAAAAVGASSRRNAAVGNSGDGSAPADSSGGGEVSG